MIGPFRSDRKQFLADVVRPLQDKRETVYVAAGSDAEDYTARRYPHKSIKRVGSGLRPSSIEGFLNGLSLVFQREKSKGLTATYHFTFTGEEAAEATVIIRAQTLEVQRGHIGEANLRVTADSRTWLGFLARERNLLWGLLRRRHPPERLAEMASWPLANVLFKHCWAAVVCRPGRVACRLRLPATR